MKAVLKMISGSELTITGEAVDTLRKIFLHDEQGAYPAQDIRWFFIRKTGINLNNVETMEFVEE